MVSDCLLLRYFKSVQISSHLVEKRCCFNTKLSSSRETITRLINFFIRLTGIFFSFEAIFYQYKRVNYKVKYKKWFGVVICYQNNRNFRFTGFRLSGMHCIYVAGMIEIYAFTLMLFQSNRNFEPGDNQHGSGDIWI